MKSHMIWKRSVTIVCYVLHKTIVLLMSDCVNAFKTYTFKNIQKRRWTLQYFRNRISNFFLILLKEIKLILEIFGDQIVLDVNLGMFGTHYKRKVTLLKLVH